MSKALVLGVAALALSGGAASAQVVYPSYGYAPYGYGYTATAPLYDYAAPAYDYAATAPLYNYAAPATAGTTIIIVTPGPTYTAPPVASGYYNYAPNYWGGYGPGRAGYWWR